MEWGEVSAEAGAGDREDPCGKLFNRDILLDIFALFNIIILEYYYILERNRKMPVYNYKCSDCSQNFEVLLRNKDDSVKCTKCGSSHIKRVYSSFDFSFKKSPAASCRSGTCSRGTCGL